MKNGAEKVAIITGASRGVGKAVAKHLAQSGYFCILIATNEDLLKDVHDSIIKLSGKSVYLAFDVSDSLKVHGAIEKIIGEFGHIDLLFNNAAILKRGTTEIPDSEIDRLLQINLNGAIFVAKHVANQMKKQRNGYIINVSSLGGKVAASFSGIYAASKFGLSGFSESLSKEMSAFDVKVTNICPSMIATEMAEGRKFRPEQMIQIQDIICTLDYLLSLSKNAVPTEICISCLPLIEKTTDALYKLYLE